MASNFSGADVEGLRDLARQFQDASDRLQRGRTSVGHQIQISAWVGPFATKFRLAWNSEHSARVSTVARELASTAAILRKNADDQAGASAADGGSSSPSGGLGVVHAAGKSNSQVNVGASSEVDSQWWWSVGGNFHSATELGTVFDGHKPPAAFGVLGRVLTVVGVVSAVATTADGISSGDGGKVGGGVVDLGITGVSAVAMPLGFALGTGKSFVDATIPYSGESQVSLLDYQAARMYGHQRDDLTPEEASGLASRYSGPWGVATMISDKMDKTWDDGAAQVDQIVTGVGDSLEQGWNWLTGRRK